MNKIKDNENKVISVAKLHLISDIHGYIEGLEQAQDIISSESPLFILGDLFNHKLGDEPRIVKTLCNLIQENKLRLIFGNHDQAMYLMFFQIDDYQLTHFELTHPSLSVVIKTLKTMFSIDFVREYEVIRNELLETDIELNEAIDNYYAKVTELCLRSNYKERYEQIKFLYQNSQMYYQVAIGDKLFLLTHSGSKDSSESRKVLTTKFQKEDKYQLQIMGHLTTPFIEDCLATEKHGLSFDCFTTEYRNSRINIVGNYTYNTYNNTLMIDDGSHTNFVTITSN